MKKIINICGTGRSGSTVMDLMIGSLEKTMSLGEINAYYYPYRRHHISPLCSCEIEQCITFNKIKNYSRKDVYNKLFEDNEIENIVDSSKSLFWIFENMKHLKGGSTEIFNIVLIKDFKSYAHSIWKRGGRIQVAYRKYISYYNMLINSGINYCLVNQSDLINNKENVSNIIRDYTGLVLKKEHFDFWNFENHYFFGSPSAKKQISNKSKQKPIGFEDKFLIDFDLFIDGKKGDILMKLKNRLKNKEFVDSRPNIKFKTWYMLKKIKTSFLSLYTRYNGKNK